MQRLNEADLKQALQDVGIEKGDHLIVHSAAIAFGLLPNGINSLLHPLQEIVGEGGTVAAPTFTFDFIKSGDYHWQNSTSIKMGALNEAIRKHPDGHRTHHPIQSVAVLGKHSKTLLENKDFSAYEENGVFDKFTQLGFKVLTLGVDPNFISLSHLSEERYQVPYRFMKEVSGEACFQDGETSTSNWGFFARKMDIPARPEKEDIIVADLTQQQRWFHTTLNGAPIASGSAKDFCVALDHELSRDPYWMLPNADEIRKLCEK